MSTRVYDPMRDVIEKFVDVWYRNLDLTGDTLTTLTTIDNEFVDLILNGIQREMP